MASSKWEALVGFGSCRGRLKTVMDGCATGASEIGPFYRWPEGRLRNSAPPYLRCGCVPLAGRLRG
eukprot:5258817-Alexandrium_andersonii.AAC.1